jgi:Tfp pilus assembly protein PilV
MTRGSRGVALIEAMVALLLLAVGIHGAASTMIRGQAELRATLLSIRAVDLAADLAELLRAGQGAVAATGLEGWRESAATALSMAPPAARASGTLERAALATGLPSSHSIVLQWWDPGLRAPRRLDLPVLAASADGMH